MTRLLLSTLAALALTAPVAAHHETPGKSHAVATVTISEPVKADGKLLATADLSSMTVGASPIDFDGNPGPQQAGVLKPDMRFDFKQYTLFSPHIKSL